MEAYHYLEQAESATRQLCRSRHSSDLLIWLRVLRLFSIGLNRDIDLPPADEPEKRAAFVLRHDFLLIAATSSKMVLDAMMAGYYTQAACLIRHMIDTWRKLLFIRVNSVSDIWRWIPENLTPEEVKNATGYEARFSIPDFNEIKKVVGANASELELKSFGKLGDIFLDLHEHCHPTFEGTTHLYFPDYDGPRVFGPTYSEQHFLRAYQAGMSANLHLLVELQYQTDLGESWRNELGEVEGLSVEWLKTQQPKILSTSDFRDCGDNS